MKKLSLALGKAGVVLSFVLPAIGLADYQGPGAYFGTANSGYATSPEQEKLLNLIRANSEANGELQKWNQLHDRNDALKKAQGSVRKRAEEEMANSEQQLDGLKRAGRNANASGLDNGVAAFQSALNPNGMHKECRVGLDFGGLQRSSQQLRDQFTMISQNLGREAGNRSEDIKEKAEKFRLKELARQEAAEKDAPGAADGFTKMFQELQGALKDPKLFVKYLQNRNQGLEKNVKQAGQVLKGMLLNQDGLVSLLAATAKDKELLVDVGNQLSTLVRNGVSGMANETDNIVQTAMDNCRYNRTQMLNIKNQVIPALEQSQFHSAKKKQRVKQMFAKAEKADCSANVDVTPLQALASSADQQIKTAASNGDAVAMYNAFSQSLLSAGDQLAQMSKGLRPLKKDCDNTAKFVDFLKQDSGTQEVVEASKSGMDINQALSQGSDAQGQAAQQAPRSNNVPALGNPIVSK